MIEPPENDAGALLHAPAANELSIVGAKSKTSLAFKQPSEDDSRDFHASVHEPERDERSFEIAQELAELNEWSPRRVLRETALMKFWQRRRKGRP